MHTYHHPPKAARECVEHYNSKEASDHSNSPPRSPEGAEIQEIRDELSQRLPGGWVQDFLTWLSAAPYTGQEPRYRRNVTDQLLEGLLKLLSGIWLAASAYCIGGWYWSLLPFGWACTVGGARHLQVTIVHQCIHHRFTGIVGIDYRIGQLLTALLLVQDYVSYRHDHVITHHKIRYFATIDDPDMAFLISLGFLPGMTKAQLWRNLFWTMVSPRFHGMFLRARFRANFVNPSWSRIGLACLLWLPVLVFTVWVNSWLYLLLVLAIPMGPLYHVSSLLQFVSEHYWLRVPQDGEDALTQYARQSHRRVLLAPAPPSDSPTLPKLVGWACWCGQIAAMTLVRFTCLVGDLPVHDWHHLFPRDPQWPNAIWEREHRVHTHPVRGPLFQDTRGLLLAIDRCLGSISAAPPLSGELPKASASDCLGM